MLEELSDDEPDEPEIEREEVNKSKGRVALFSDEDTRLFYERLGELFSQCYFNQQCLL